MISTPTPTPLVVPIRLDALMVGANDGSFTQFAPAYANFTEMATSSSNTASIGNDLLNQPFEGQGPLPQGIHLHWSLPRALRTADYADGSGPLQLPPAPNRWLVTRTIIAAATSEAPSVTQTAWVVESDYVDSTGAFSQTAIPYGTDPSQPYTYLGRVYPLADWTGDPGSGTYLSTPLTAVGFGIPDFAGCYRNCGNVFGMLDDTLNDDSFDASTMVLLYSVTGWYSDASNDPLAGADPDAVAAAFGWTYSDTDYVPSQTLCHGVVYQVPWDSGSAFLSDQTGPLSTGVAFGNTPSEAFAAYAASAVESDNLPQVEQILDALQLGVLPQLGQPSGLLRLEKAIYNAAYTAFSNGHSWRLRATGAKGDFPQPSDDLAASMNQLMTSQDDLNALQAHVITLQARIFNDWYRYIIARYAADPPASPSETDMENYIESEIGALAKLQEQIEELQTSIARQASEISAGLPGNLSLDVSAAERFYGAPDPVVLLTGDGVPSVLPEDGEEIGCVFLSPSSPPSITLAAGLVSGSALTTVAADLLPAPTLPTGLPDPAATCLTAAAGLVQSDLLIVPAASNVVTLAAASQGGTANPAVLDFATTNTDIAQAQTDWLSGQAFSGIDFSSAPIAQPDIACLSWQLPWRPIALSWSANYYPLLPLAGLSDAYAADAVTSQFDFDPSVSLNLFPTDPDFDSFVELSGTALLSTDASTSMQAQIAAYLTQHDDPELQQILTDLGSTPLLSQALSGLNTGLLGRVQTLQLLIADPSAVDPLAGSFTNHDVRNAVGEENRFAPSLGSGATDDPVYNPLRGGQFVPQKLKFIDSFGRSRAIQMGTAAIAYTLRDVSVDQGFVLPLRFTQATQLTADWLAAANPSLRDCGLAATNPICGWLVPNTLDSSLMYYDADGSAIGSHIVSAGTLIWQSAPNAGPPGQSFEESFVGRNAVLTAFASAIEAVGATYAGSLLLTIERTQAFVLPDGHQLSRQTAMLVGTPLALVQAKLDLAMAGLPVPDQSYAALAQDIDNTDVLDRTLHGLDDIEIPVVLGNQLDLDDGLMGFFLAGDDGEANFSLCYAAQADGSSDNVVVPAADDLTLTLNADQPTLVAMLIDPRSSVHLNTGLLPVRELSLAAETCNAALSRMSFSFLTAPVLAPAGSFAIPTPREGGGTWGWITYQNGDWLQQSIQTPLNTASLQRAQNVQEGWLQLTQLLEID
ncbi:MAG: hypothetical protein E5X48_07100 [Mesorhizobium sp.]|uniref:hypothetical protein n=1 Tax=Mesorhizobium sp. TaxID=1871066 RepID=UPI00120B114B|nr:hypothetical protein [Mesorhizobium sp.]TIQ37128.1 MAG: hypothetical protein E5X48_07100 [Mesorhizobium sp.]